MTVKNLICLKLNRVNYLCFITGKVNEHIEENKRNKYLTVVCTDEIKSILEQYGELWIKIRNFIRSINKYSGNYHEEYMKITFNSDDD